MEILNYLIQKIKSFNLCMLGNFSCFLSSDDFFSKLTFSKNSFRNTLRTAQSVTCLATDACLTADPEVASSIPYFR